MSLSAALFALAPAPAEAGGFEVPGSGTEAMGRGGAFYARADNPMALRYNPANLLNSSGFSVYVSGGIAWFDACHTRLSDPTGTYADTTTSNGNNRFDPDASAPDVFLSNPWPRVCNDGGPGPLLNIAASWRPIPELAFGVGVLTPHGVGHGSWAGPDFNIDGGPVGVRPPPARYILLEQNQVVLWPSIGVAYSPVEWLRLGATFQWGVGSFNFTTQTVPFPGEDPALDVLARLDAVDGFIPAGIFSAHFIPHDNLDVMLGFRVVSDVQAGASTELTYGYYGLGDAAAGVDGPVPTTTRVEDVTLRAGQPWELSLGLRYAHRITPRPRDPSEVERLSGRIEDSMSNEWFDVELDVVWEMNHNINTFVVDLPTDAMLNISDVQMGSVNNTTLPLPDQLTLPHQWNDQLSIRLGGDLNLIPGLASLRLGFSYETSAYNGLNGRNAKQYVGLDFIPSQRFGVHGGLTVRVGRFDISLAYAHIFQETVEVSPSEAALRQLSATSMASASIINAGIYEVDFDMLTMSVNWHI